MKRCVLIIIAFLMGSCYNIQLKNQMQDILGAEVNLPHNLEYVNGNDSLTVDLNKLKPIKLIQYYDPTECVLCKATSLNDWLNIHGLTQENLNFGLYIIFAPSPIQYDEIKKILRFQDKKYSIYLDRDNLYFKKNESLLNNKIFHTLLLDKNNRVVLVGNPLANDKMWSLFKSTLDNMLAHDGVYVPEK